MASLIHPTAIIEKSVLLGKNVKVGPYCVLTENVELDDEVELISHVTLAGRTKIGKGTKIYPFCSIGHPTQDLKYRGEPSTLSIGTHNIIREYVTIQAGTAGGIMKTELGNHCLLMASTHVAHDCILGNHVIMANNATLAGHVVVEDHVIIGGLAAIHQFVRIGTHAIIGGMSPVEHDVIPYGAVKGERASLYGLNLIGLKRRGVERDEMGVMREAYNTLFSQESTLAERVQKTAEKFQNYPRVMEIINFIRSESTRSLCVPKDHESL